MVDKPKKIIAPQDADAEDAAQTVDFKQSLVDTLQESNTARNEMKVVMHEILRQPDTVQEIKAIVCQIDRNAMTLWWQKFGFMIWSAVIFILGVIVTVIIQNYLKR